MQQTNTKTNESLPVKEQLSSIGTRQESFKVEKEHCRPQFKTRFGGRGSVSHQNPFKNRKESFMVEEEYHDPQLQGRLPQKDRACPKRRGVLTTTK